MNLAYLTDQILPRTATDTTQMVSMASAFAGVQMETEGTTTIVCPRSWIGKPATASDIARYYSVEERFRVATVRSVFPCIRGIEKLAQGWRAPASRIAQESDVLYTRTLPILITSLLLDAGPIVYETYRPWPVQNTYNHDLFRWIGSHPLFVGAILHSDYARQSYEGIGMPSEKLMTAHNGYDPSHYRARKSKEEARVLLGITHDQNIVVYSGRINSKKGLGVVLDMARRLPDVDFLLVGSEGNGSVELEAASIPNVFIHPWCSHPQTLPFLSAADVLIIPPSTEPLMNAGNTVLPIKTFMYMASERPILAGATPDLAEILEDGINACLIKPDDVDMAVAALTALLIDPERCAKLARNAAETVGNLTWESRARRILSFIQDRI